MIVRLKTNRDLIPLLPRSLSLDRVYRVLAIEANSFRLLSGNGEHDGPYLYPRVFFQIIDPTEPKEWCENISTTGERWTQPAGFGPHTWERYFDGDPDAIQRVRAYLLRCSPCFWEFASNEHIPYGPGTRTGILDRLRLLATPGDQLALNDQIDLDDMTESVLNVLTDLMLPELRSDAEREAVRQVDRVAERVWNELINDRHALPPLVEFVKTPQAAALAHAAAEALRVMMRDDYHPFPGTSSV